jgi:transcriptional regulator with XRE-family HTH domain
MNFGKAIRIVRTAHGLSKAQLAERLSIGASYLSLIEAEKRKPSLRVLEEISSALLVPPHLLMLLASDAGDLDDPKNADRVVELAHSLVRLLVSAGSTPVLPLEVPGRRKKIA